MVESGEQYLHGWHEPSLNGLQKLLNLRVCNTTERIGVVEVDEWLVAPVHVVI